jgi:hypothetical protein
VQPSDETLSIHEDANGAPIPVRARTEDILFDGHQSTLVVPQPLADDEDTTVFFQADLDGTVQSMGPAWTDVTDLPPSEAVGRPLSDLVLSADQAATANALSALHEEQADVRHHVASFRTKRGRRDLALRAQLVQNAGDAPASIVGTLTPVSDEAPLPDDASEAPIDTPAEPPSAPPTPPTPSDPPPADDPSSDGDTAKHDVFSPSLPSFQNPDEAAEDKADTGDAAPADPTSELDDEPPAPTPEPFDLTARLNDLVDEHTDAPAHDHLDIQRSFPDGSCPVRLDPSVVDTIFGTLLENALSHTDKGSITIGLKADEDEVHVEIVDTGTGVEERFMQVYMDAANPSSADNLQRVLRLAERIGGSMNMEDAASGTRFELTLPRSLTEAPSDVSPPSAD